MVNFFIERPVFSTVISLLTLLAGTICMLTLPVALYPQITPPQVSVVSNYPGASALTVADTVSAPIEQNVNGVKGMLYVSSVSTDNGVSLITVTFDVGYSQDIAAVDVQNKVAVAEPSLPDTVKQFGTEVKKTSTSLVTVVSLISPKGTYTADFLGNYGDIYVKDALKRVPGVGDVTLLGLRKYSMRIWLDPDKLGVLRMSPNEVIAAIRQENLQASAGKIGASPAPKGQSFELKIDTEGRLTDKKQFEQIIVRSRPGGSIVRVADVARVELGGENYESSSNFNGQPAATLLVYQLSDANALDIRAGVVKEMERLKAAFPNDVEYVLAYDSTRFITENIAEVQKTLIEAIILVIVVVFLFLQGWRATLIPLIAIPVSLVGTFIFIAIFGFSINSLTLFGLVLAIGLVVDDAIVVVENVERQLEAGVTDLMIATKAAMSQVSAPIIATTLVLMAVFIPVAFTPGLTGRLYNQFALTIAFSFGLSCINSLTLSPVLARLILRHRYGPSKFFFFRWFNAAFGWIENLYASYVRIAARHWYAVVALLVMLCFVAYQLVATLPTGFVPEEDQGYVIIAVQLPEGATLERTQNAVIKVRERILATEGVKSAFELVGFSLLAGTNKTNAATIFAVLNPWEDRKAPHLHAKSIIGSLYGSFASVPEARVLAFSPPPIQGLSATGGFEFVLQDRGGMDAATMGQVAQRFIDAANQRPELARVYTTYSASVPHLEFVLDRSKARTVEVPVADIFSTLQAYLGSVYVNDFNLDGRSYKVVVQAEGDYRALKDDILNLRVRNEKGKMIPLSTLGEVKYTIGPDIIERYNLFKSVKVYGGPAPGYSSGQAVAAMQAVAAQTLPDGMGYDWTGVTYQELKTGNVSGIIFGLALLTVFLLLAAQYESYLMPLAVLFSVPFAVLGAALGLHWRGLSLDVYGQVGLVLLIGLAAKNAILIVEFAVKLRAEGKSPIEAAAEAARLRLRPILMTAFAFILGVVPLAIATGAGAGSRVSLGTTVFSGMVVGTALALLTVPIFYSIIARMQRKPLPAPSISGVRPAVRESQPAGH